MNRKFIKIATSAIFLLAFAVLPIQADDSAAGSAGIALSTVTTISGKVFKEVELITADANGLLFRHSQGTAKVDFTDLNDNLREMFEPEQIVETKPNAPIEADQEEGDYESLEIYTRTRIVVALPQVHQSHCALKCNPFDPRNVNWRSHWGRYHYGLSYANFYCRQAAERDLLIRSGFLR